MAYNIYITVIFNTLPESDKNNRIPYWINTDDGFSYYITDGACQYNCTKENINRQENLQDTVNASVFVIVIDVNGAEKGPFELEEQELQDDKKMKPLQNDHYFIYVGSDGITPGNRLKTVTGRIMAGVK